MTAETKLYEIKSWLTGKVLFALECGSLRLCVQAAVERKIVLRGADLRGAVLSGADLSGADLSGAVLRDAVLRRADLSRADLRRADLSGADLSRADLSRAVLSSAVLRRADLRRAVLSGADLRDADLSGADLSRADLSRADLRDAPVIPNIHAAVYEAASQPGALDMAGWHNACGTAHCRAGWVVTLAGEAGLALEKEIGTPAAATEIYLASDSAIGKFPDFYCDNETALADMKARAEAEVV